MGGATSGKRKTRWTRTRPRACGFLPPKLAFQTETPRAGGPARLHKQCTLLPMRAVVQRVSRASVTVDGKVFGQIGRGLLVLLAITHADTEAAADYLAERIAGLRIFEDDAGKMNL